MVDHSTRDAAFATSSNTQVTRKSDYELAVTRTFDALVQTIFKAWTQTDHFKQWWVPQSSGAVLRSCEQDVRVGGRHRVEITHPKVSAPMAFYGTYLEVAPNSRLVWTNEENEAGAVTTVSFNEVNGGTRVSLEKRYPTAQALDQALQGMQDAMSETFDQLEALLAARR